MLNLPVSQTSAFLAAVLVSGSALAGDKSTHSEFDQAFQKGVRASGIAGPMALNQFRIFDPSAVFDSYTKTPKAAEYYQANTALKNDAYTSAASSPAVADIRHVEDVQSGVDKGSLAREVGRISQTQDLATDSDGNISDEFKSCTKIQSCTTSWTEQSCEMAPEVLRQQCMQRLNISMVPEEVHENHVLSMHLYARDHTYAGVTWNTVTGEVVFLGPREAGFTHTGNLPASAILSPIRGEILKAEPGNKFTHVDQIGYPAAGNPNLSLHISGSQGSADMTLQVRLETTAIIQKPVDEWVDGCLGLSSLAGCLMESSQCSAGSATRIINGMPVTRDCWEKTLWYSCFQGQGTNACQPLTDQGCEQVSMDCLDRKNAQDSICMRWHRVYHCPVRTCRDTGLSCQGETYCLEGDCLSHERKPDGDFQRALSALNGSLDTGAHFDAVHVFAGKAQSCDDLILGAANCCRDSGWLIDDLPLYHCSPEEKDLGRARESGRAHYIGPEESFMKKTRVFCVFPSMLARIIQEQGREKQLGRHFGSARHPDCSGMAPEELQAIDFGRIDFSDFYAEIEKKKTLTSHEEMERRIREKMQELIDEGKAHGKKLPA